MITPGILRKAWAMLGPREKRVTLVVFAISFVAAIASAVMIGSIMPFLTVLSNPEAIRRYDYLAWAYERFGFTSDYDFLLFAAGMSLSVVLVSGLIQLAKNYALSHYTSMRVHTIGSRLLSNYLAQEYEFFLSRHSGEMAKEIFSEAGLVVNNFYKPAMELVASAFTTLAIVAMLFMLNPLAAFGVLSVLGTVFGVTLAISRPRVRRYGELRAAYDGQRFRIANEALGGIKDIKIVGREDAYQKRFRTPSLAVARVRVLASLFTMIPQLAIQLTVYSGVILVCLLSVDRQSYLNGTGAQDVLPLVAVFGIAAQRLMPEMQKAYAGLMRLLLCAPAVESVYRDISRRSAQRRARPGTARIPLAQALAYDAVSYRYPGSETGGLRDISLTIRAGEKIGIVGPTGAGKTTLADITLGLLRPGTGRLVVDGREIDDAALAGWQASVGYVPQDIFLTDATVLENIAFGTEGAEIDEARARRCGRMAQLDDFVLRDMPEGYSSAIGERGVRLSGGQRQRIGIARALYRDADLIVFDEATSALDNVTERDVIAAIEALPGNKTIMMVAHRLSTVRICDRILVLEGGRVAGFDTWEGLMKNCPAFHRLAHAPGAQTPQEESA